MAKYNPRLAKTNRSYLVEEISELYKVHKNTVNNWIKEGLKLCVVDRPRLVHGQDLSDFLSIRRKKNKRPCKPGEIYCVACKSPKIPYANQVELQKINEFIGNLLGNCPTCGSRLFRKVSLSKLEQSIGKLTLTNSLNQ